MIRKTLLIMFLIAAAAGCTMIPHYNRPAAPIPSEWPNGPAYKGGQQGGSTVAETGWHDFYSDERLQKVIGLALTNNRDLRVATANVERARALYGIQRNALFPAVGVAGNYTEQRVPVDLSQTHEAYNTRNYSVNAGITAWEIDFFGRIRSLKESALEQYFATAEGRNSAQIALISEVANVYLTRAADCQSLRLSQSTLEARQASYNMTRRRFELGASSSLDERQAQTLLEGARVDVAGYTRRVALDENALNLLVGATVPTELLADDLGKVAPPKDVSPGLSSEVLLNRPDVLQTEHLLRSANADIGAARAAFFPRISLTTSIGTISPDLSGLFKAGSATWLFSPQISLPIFDARLKPAYEASKIDRDIAVFRYEKAIQVAFKETADALAQRGTLGDQVAAQQSLVDAASDAYRLSNARYEKGIDNYLVVLDSQRSLYAAQQGLIGLRLARLSNLVTLYKVLGGGM